MWHIFSVDRQKHFAFVVLGLGALSPSLDCSVLPVHHEADFVEGDSCRFNFGNDLGKVDGVRAFQPPAPELSQPIPYRSLSCAPQAQLSMTRP